MPDRLGVGWAVVVSCGSATVIFPFPTFESAVIFLDRADGGARRDPGDWIRSGVIRPMVEALADCGWEPCSRRLTA